MPLVSVDLQSVPTVHTEGYSSLVTDSGVPLFRMTAEICDMFSNGGDEYLHFPKGIYVERFDSLFQVEGTIEADTAFYYKKRDIWHAIGNVFVKNMEGLVFETSELMWDVKAPSTSGNAFYTNQPVKITKPDSTVMNGKVGFRADQSLNSIFLFSASGDFYFEETAETPEQATLSDSIRQQ